MHCVVGNHSLRLIIDRYAHHVRHLLVAKKARVTSSLTVLEEAEFICQLLAT